MRRILHVAIAAFAALAFAGLATLSIAAETLAPGNSPTAQPDILIFAVPGSTTIAKPAAGGFHHDSTCRPGHMIAGCIYETLAGSNDVSPGTQTVPTCTRTVSNGGVISTRTIIGAAC